MSSWVIGIDPDAVKSGIGIFKDGELVELKMWSFAELLFQMESLESRQGTVVVLEDVEAIRPTFKRGKTNQAAMQKISQNVGQVKQTARLIKEMAEYHGVKVVMQRPLTGWFKKAKEDAALFNKLTGWTGRSNADNRDGAMLALHYIRGQKQRAS
ncbi:hypothetical protein SAMN05660443_0231 [Marinospirillum celere]|uniref:Uncharacterized protein n=1 Tax=Marinospirillum celere TaxID=1122252 RepID=A0A1I1DZD1_9GAMM|nr:hypothetical protein [Marinospirillum celere]SFB80419.1 hypothetical protein SAMN05660443_0231 [Marinospirillum celere]